MLQRTGWRIKQLISSRGSRDIEDQEDRAQDDDRAGSKTNATSGQRQSWSLQSPSPEVGFALRRTTSSSTQDRPLPPPEHPSTMTAHSSMSSLCSCDGVHIDCDSDTSGNKHSLSQAGPGPRQSNPNPDILYLPPLKSSTSLGSDAKTWNSILSGSPPKTPVFSSQRYIFESQNSSRIPTGLDFFEALAIDPRDDDTTPTPTPSVKSMADSKMESNTDNVERLMREADAAFEAVGTALEDAKAATQGFDSGGTSALRRSISIPRRVARKQQRPVTPMKSHPQRSGTAVRAKRKKSARKQTKLLNKPVRKVFAHATTPSTRWTLTDMTANVADMFSTKMFRTEVDEMLTPDRMNQLREGSRTVSEPKPSTESSRSNNSAITQSEPFHLEAVASRIDAVQANPSPFAEPVLPPPVNHPIPRKNVFRRGRREKAEREEHSIDELDMMIKELRFPSPPQMRRGTSDSRGDIPLDTIPEILPLNSFTCPPAPTISDGKSEVLSEQAYIYLPSTKFTLNSPGFRQGPIRLDNPLKKRKGSFESDEGLDWTAFQMAVSGGVLEDEEAEEYSGWKADERDLDSIVEWWEGFGYERPGDLVGESEEKRRKKRKVDKDWYEADVSSGSETPRIKEPQAPKEPTQAERKEAPESEPVFWKPRKQLPGPRTSVEDADESEFSIESLPPSPMLDIVVPSPGKPHQDLIPMGYNLGHDLGDFLTWGAVHGQSSLFPDD